MASGPKMKPIVERRNASRRPSGKFKRERAYLQHIRTCKTTKQKRRLRQQTYVSGAEASGTADDCSLSRNHILEV